MRVFMEKVVLIVALGVFAASPSFADMVGSDASGRAVILYDDGTWKYADAAPAQPAAPAPQAAPPVATALGCYKDQGAPQGTEGRDLNGYITNASDMTNGKCVATCAERGFRYSATQYGSFCFCGNAYGRSGPAANCDTPCSGSAGETCGGTWANSVSSTGL